jgi:tetratricopeptide (TPR) repeat protein
MHTNTPTCGARGRVECLFSGVMMSSLATGESGCPTPRRRQARTAVLLKQPDNKWPHGVHFVVTWFARRQANQHNGAMTKVERSRAPRSPLPKLPDGVQINLLSRWLETVSNRALFVPELPARLRTVSRRLAGADSKLFESDEPGYLIASSLLAELYRYCGRPADAAAGLHRGQAILDSTEHVPMRGINLARRTLLRDRVRYAANFVMSTDYATGRLRHAEVRLQRLCSLVQDGLATETFPCHGTLRSIYLDLAFVNSDLGDERTAAKYFGRSLQSNTEKLHLRQRAATTGVAFHHAARALLGLGLLEYMRGALARVLWFVHPARALISETPDQVTRAHVEHLFGTVCTEDFETIPGDGAHFEEGVRNLERARQTFIEFEHSRGIISSTLDLATALTSAKDYDRAESLLGSIVVEAPDINSVCHALVGLSRIARERNSQAAAVEFASSAIDRVGRDDQNQGNLVVIRAAALFARAEAYLMRPADGARARADLDEAKAILQPGFEQQRIEALYWLHMASSHCQDESVRSAQSCLAKAEAILPAVERASVHRLAATVRREVKSLAIETDLVIGAVSRGVLDYHEHLEELQQYLLSLAKQKFETDREIGRALGVSPATVNTWSNKHWRRNSD